MNVTRAFLKGVSEVIRSENYTVDDTFLWLLLIFNLKEYHQNNKNKSRANVQNDVVQSINHVNIAS
jgi:hypothetical protein